MKTKIIVSLVSEQAIPNVLFIKEMESADLYYFISTEKMEENTKNTTQKIAEVCCIPENKIRIIRVIEDSTVDIEAKLTKIELGDDDEMIVNITGGTKIMSIGAYNYFSKLGGITINYLPIGKNIIKQVFPNKTNDTKKLKFRIGLREYLKSSGVNVNNKIRPNGSELTKSKEETEAIFQLFLSSPSDFLCLAAKIRIKRNARPEEEKLIKKSEELFTESTSFFSKAISFCKKDQITKKEVKYLTGEWFEEYIYSLVKETLSKGPKEIETGINISKIESSNELDIAFTHNNNLVVIECKTDISDEKGQMGKIFLDTIYKANSLKKEFGLFVTFHIFVLNDLSKLRPVDLNRAKLFGINLVGLETIKDQKKLSALIKCS